MATDKIYYDRWRLVGDLVEAGQSWTHIVTDIQGNGETRYVLKRLKNPKRLDRFQREVEAVRSLSHPGIVRLIDFGFEATGKERPYLVTELCEGGSLGDEAAKAEAEERDPFWRQGEHGPLPSPVTQPLTALHLLLEICEAMSYAHSQGIVHRDVKPDNIFLKPKSQGGWMPVVGDFGICYVEGGERFTLLEEAVGPRGFMAPEVEEGRAEVVSSASDVYSLGKLLYWLLTGKTVPREAFREQKRDLKGYTLDSVMGWNNIYLEHINRLLDYMIVHDPAERRSLSNLLILLRRAIRAVEKEFNPVSDSVPQPCIYCGQGIYRHLGTSPTELHNFGLKAVSGASWRLLVCNNCGHIQMFRPSLGFEGAGWDREVNS